MKMTRKRASVLMLAALLASSVLAAPAAPPAMAMVEKFDFKGSNEDWGLRSDASSSHTIDDGYFVLTNLSSSKPLLTGWNLGIDRTKDFALESDFTVLGGIQGAAAGLAWDYKDDDNYYAFCVFPDGTWSILRMRNRSVSTIAGPEASPTIRNNGSYNRLKVARAGSFLSFAINGTTVKTLPFESIGGAYSGFYAGPRIIVRSDNLVLSLNRDYEGERLGRPATDKVVYETSFAKGSDPWTLVRRPVAGKLEAPYFDGGGLALSHADPNTYSALTRPFDFDTSKDFSVEAALRNLSDDDDYGFGLTLDRRGNDYLYFRLTGSGFYSIGRRSAGKTETWVEWTPHPNVNKYESSNLLGVYRRGDRLYFCINGRKVHERDYWRWGSTELGFILGGITKVRPEFLGVYASSP